jgi:beta-exotoxin I transport system permease protein
MRALVLKLLRDLRWPLLVVALLLAGFQCLWVKIAQRTVTQIAPFFSTLANRAGASQKAIEDVIFGGPGKLAQSVIGGESIHFERAMDTLSIGYVHPLMQIIFGLWAIGRAAGALAGEIDRGTMELLLAQPIARWKVVAAHLAVDALVIPVLCLSLWSGTLLGVQIVGPFQVTDADLAAFSSLPFKIVVAPELLDVDPMAFGPALVNVAGLLFSLSGLTMALSAVGRFRNRVIGVAVLMALLMFLINAVGQLWDVLNPWRPLTVFFYYQPQAIALHNKWTVDPSLLWTGSSSPVNVIAVLCGVGAVGYALALAVFTRRDLPAPL